MCLGRTDIITALRLLTVYKSQLATYLGLFLGNILWFLSAYVFYPSVFHMLCAIVNGIFISIPDCSLLVYSNIIDFYTLKLYPGILPRDTGIKN